MIKGTSFSCAGKIEVVSSSLFVEFKGDMGLKLGGDGVAWNTS